MPLRVHRGRAPRRAHTAGPVDLVHGSGLSGVLVVGAAIVDDLAAPRRLLAARRSAPSALAGGWELPGGKVEAGEGPRGALRRELREELGVEVALGAELLPEVGAAWLLPGVGLLRVWWAVVVGDQEPTPLEDHDALRWLDRDDWVGGVAWLPADMPVVTAVRAAAG